MAAHQRTLLRFCGNRQGEDLQVCCARFFDFVFLNCILVLLKSCVASFIVSKSSNTNYVMSRLLLVSVEVRTTGWRPVQIGCKPPPVRVCRYQRHGACQRHGTRHARRYTPMVHPRTTHIQLNASSRRI